MGEVRRNGEYDCQLGTHSLGLYPLATGEGGGGFGTSKQNISEINLAHICSGCEYEGSQCFLSACCV